MLDHILDFIQSIDPIKGSDDAGYHQPQREHRAPRMGRHHADHRRRTNGSLRTYGAVKDVQAIWAKYLHRQEPSVGRHVPSAAAGYTQRQPATRNGLQGAGRQREPWSNPIGRPGRSWGVPAKAQGLAGKLGDAMGVAPRKERKERY